MVFVYPLLLDFRTDKLYCQEISDFSKSQFNIQTQEKEFLKKGEEHFFKKNFNVSEIFFKKLIEMNPENSLAHSYLGEIYLYYKKLEEAIYHYQLAVELFLSQNIFPEKEYFRLSQAYYLKKEKDKSKEYCNLVLKRNSNFSPCYYYLGIIALEFEKNREIALQNFSIYLEKIESKSGIPSYFEMEKEKIKLLIEYLNNPEVQQKNVSLQEELDPLKFFYKNFKENNKPPIKTNEEKKIEFNLPFEKIFDQRWIEIQYLKENHKEKAIEKLIEYKNSTDIKSAKENFLIRKSLCSIYLEKKELDKAEKECKEAILYDYDSQTLFYLALLYYKAKNFELFESYIKKYLEIEKFDISSYFMLAEYYYQVGKFQEALLYFEKILSLNANHKESLYYEFEIYKEFNKIQYMKNIAEKIELFYPNDYELLRYIIFTLVEKQEKEFAIEMINKIYKKNKDKIDGLVLAGLYQQTNQKEKVKEILIELYQNYPNEYEIVKAIILFFLEEETNYDTIEKILKKFLLNANPEQKEEILKIIPESIKAKINEQN